MAYICFMLVNGFFFASWTCRKKLLLKALLVMLVCLHFFLSFLFLFSFSRSTIFDESFSLFIYGLSTMLKEIFESYESYSSERRRTPSATHGVGFRRISAHKGVNMFYACHNLVLEYGRKYPQIDYLLLVEFDVVY